jgi:uncharacterized protein (TIGR03437 family)
LSYLSANLSPGELVTIFGANFSEPGIYTPVSLPLPTQLDGVSVTVNGIPAPILAVANVTGQEQINLQVPYDFSQTAPGEEAVPIVVNTTLYGNSLPTYAQCSLASQRGTIVAGADPGIATTDGTNGAIQHGADYSLVTSATRPSQAKSWCSMRWASGRSPRRWPAARLRRLRPFPAPRSPHR